MAAPHVLFSVHREISDDGAYGTMWFIHPDKRRIPFALTLERTYESGPKRIKIPDGIWYCDRRRYNKGNYPTFEIHVPGHEFILFHKGNIELHSDGCVLVAENFHDFDPGKGLQGAGIASSRAGFTEFMSLAEGENHFFTEFKTIGGQ